MKNSKTIKNVIDVLTAFIYFCGITTILALLVHLLSRMGLFKDLIQTGRLSFDVNGIQLFPKTPQPLWQLLFPLVSSAIYIYLLLTIRSFLQNLYQEKIFSHSNIDLCNRAWKILLVLSFLSGSIETSGNAHLLPFTFRLTFNTGLLLSVPIVWALGKILERGIAIAEENELTI